MPGIEIKGRSKIANYRHGGRTKKFGGGRTNLLEELGRVEAEPSNRNRRAEISRVHGELNRGYAKGGRAGYGIGTIVKGAKKIISKIKPKPKGKGLGSGIKPSEAKDVLKSSGQSRAEYLRQWSPHFGGRSLKQEMKETAKKGKAKGGRAGFAHGSERKGAKKIKWEKPDWLKRRDRWKKLKLIRPGT